MCFPDLERLNISGTGLPPQVEASIPGRLCGTGETLEGRTQMVITSPFPFLLSFG